ncbi:unnamed protein product [Urochloa decumbens]|uniref:Uncharacterized protein n=1 Tax=Urochloa decumbens TaxID=240449 RepID=A0ABC8WL95_9POAL
MKTTTTPSSLVALCLAILTTVLIIVLAVHVEPALAGSREANTPPAPHGRQDPGSHGD